MDKTWKPVDSAPEEFRAQFPEMHPVVLQLLWNRNVRTQGEMDVFLGPDWSRDVFSHALFRHMDAAVARAFAALEKGEVITVHGDYDADGVSGSTVLLCTLRDICRAFGFDEKTLTSFIPDREKDGYGMSVGTIEHLHAHDKARLVITVDCGISNKPAIDRGHELGIDTVVCDHHTMPAELPDAILIHPLVPGETYPNKTLCGTGVAFKFACGLIEEARQRWTREARAAANPFPEGYEKWLLDLVAIATVTDVMPLTGENRVLETFGLFVLNKTKRVGLRKLIEIAGGTLGSLDTYSIGFQIGPRINAAGRMRHASIALNLLLEEDELKAAVLADELNAANVSRQKASEAMYQEAVLQVGEIGDRKLIVAVGEGWAPGLVGLVAGKLVSLYGCPVYVAGKNEEGKYVGSGRSVEGFDVTDCMRAAAEHFDKFGGHPQACGFSVTGEEKFNAAVLAMNAYANRMLADRVLVPTVRVDAEVDLADVTWDFHDQLQRFAPFGEANPKPLFAARGLSVAGVNTMGADGKHLRLSVTSPRGKMAKMVAFGFGAWAAKLHLGDFVDAVFEVGVNEWNGNRELQLRVVDLKNSRGVMES